MGLSALCLLTFPLKSVVKAEAFVCYVVPMVQCILSTGFMDVWIHHSLNKTEYPKNFKGTHDKLVKNEM